MKLAGISNVKNTPHNEAVEKAEDKRISETESNALNKLKNYFLQAKAVLKQKYESDNSANSIPALQEKYEFHIRKKKAYRLSRLKIPAIVFAVMFFLAMIDAISFVPVILFGALLVFAGIFFIKSWVLHNTKAVKLNAQADKLYAAKLQEEKELQERYYREKEAIEAKIESLRDANGGRWYSSTKWKLEGKLEEIARLNAKYKETVFK